MMQFFQGNKDILKEEEEKDLIKKYINKTFSSSHLSFLLGAGCSIPAIPPMSKM